MWEAVFVFAVAFVSEVAWTAWAYSVQKLNPIFSGFWAAVIVYLGGYTIKAFVEKPHFIHLWALGVGLGSVAVVLYQRRKTNGRISTSAH